jgi:hypothetical protein
MVFPGLGSLDYVDFLISFYYFGLPQHSMPCPITSVASEYSEVSCCSSFGDGGFWEIEPEVGHSEAQVKVN